MAVSRPLSAHVSQALRCKPAAAAGDQNGASILSSATPAGAHPVLISPMRGRTAPAYGGGTGLDDRSEGTPGRLVPPVRGYEELAAELGVAVGELRGIVKRGRQRVTVELAARGLIPMPRAVMGMAEAIEAEQERLVANG